MTDHIEHFEATMRNQRRIDRAKEIREEQRCSVQEAVAIETREFLTRRIKEIEAALEQALDCIRGEAPEDMTHEEAREDTISKIRAVLLP
jgi:hypothetical protein